MSMDTVGDFALFGFGVRGDGEAWALGGVSDFGGRCARRSDDRLGVSGVSKGGGWLHERDGGGTELCLSRDDFDSVGEDVDGCRGGGHVAVVWKCCRR